MKIFKIIAAAVAIAGFTALAAGSANAQLTGFANAGGNNPGAGDYISYTPGTGGGFTLITNNGFINSNTLGPTSPATINFGTLTNIPGEYHGPTVFNGFTYSQQLNGGSFTIMKGSTDLLSGTFGPSTLTGNDSSPGGSPGTSAGGSINLLSDSVTYTGGTYFNPALYSPNNGSLAITFNASAPIVANSSNIMSFVANDTITFSALPLPRLSTPESSSVAGLGIGLLGILGLCFMGMRRRANTIS